ncbi:hypothetical protein J7M23_06015 [Candidatus Sumerlaeota bacterium]|nr:hypothetical protein [Candidatus Sumerlaeota bacterium]
MHSDRVNVVLYHHNGGFYQKISKYGETSRHWDMERVVHKKRIQATSTTLVIVMVVAGVVFIGCVGWLYLSSRTPQRLPEPVRKAVEYPKSIIGAQELDKEITALRKKIQRIKEEWQSGEKKESLLKELENVKSRFERLKEHTAPEARKRFNTLVENTEEVISGLREKFESVGDRLDHLLHNLDQITPKLSPKEKKVKPQEEEKNEKQESSD